MRWPYRDEVFMCNWVHGLPINFTYLYLIFPPKGLGVLANI